MSTTARKMAEAVGSRFSRDKADRTAPHGDALTDTPTSVTEAEETGGLAMRRETRERLLAETVEIEVVSHPRQMAEKVLGKGPHPAAIRRLFELWPEARVSIRYTDRRYDGVDSKVTTVVIAASPTTPATEAVYAEARCRLDCDTWNRRHGIRLAFNRALKLVKVAEDVRIMGGAAPTRERSTDA